MKLIGIDLGTTHTTAAIDQKVFPLDPGRGPLLPSVVAFPPSGATLIGDAAVQRKPIDPRNTIYSAKRLIGRRWISGDTAQFKQRYPFDLAPSEDGYALFKTRRGPFSPIQIGELVLGVVRARAPVPLSGLDAVFTVPTMFQQEQRDATLQAASRLGLAAARVLDEPIAVAQAYRIRGGSRARFAVVYDFGGGTFNLAIIDCARTPFGIVGHGGDLYLGGDDVDQKLAAWAADQVLATLRWDLRADPEGYARLIFECEQAKIRLIGAAQTTIDLTQVDPAAPESVTELAVDRPTLDKLIFDLVRKTFLICDEVLRGAGLKPRDIDEVYLAGGTTLLPTVQAGVQAYFGRPIRYEYHPMHVVAIGASIP